MDEETWGEDDALIHAQITIEELRRELEKEKAAHLQTKKNMRKLGRAYRAAKPLRFTGY